MYTCPCMFGCISLLYLSQCNASFLMCMFVLDASCSWTSPTVQCSIAICRTVSSCFLLHRLTRHVGVSRQSGSAHSLLCTRVCYYWLMCHLSRDIFFLSSASLSRNFRVGNGSTINDNTTRWSAEVNTVSSLAWHLRRLKPSSGGFFTSFTCMHMHLNLTFTRVQRRCRR